MKSTGIVRRMDMLGRIVMPKAMRRVLGIKTGDALEIFTEDNRIILMKYERGCVFCGSLLSFRNEHDMKMIEGKMVCRECIADL